MGASGRTMQIVLAISDATIRMAWTFWVDPEGLGSFLFSVFLIAKWERSLGFSRNCLCFRSFGGTKHWKSFWNPAPFYTSPSMQAIQDRYSCFNAISNYIYIQLHPSSYLILFFWLWEKVKTKRQCLSLPALIKSKGLFSMRLNYLAIMFRTC